MTKGADLYHLQCLDREGDTKRRRLAEVEAALGESEELRRARRAVEEAQTQVKRATVSQRDLELQTQGISDKISRSEQRLYSGVVKNPKELTDLQAEVAALRRRQQKLEDDLLATMIDLEEAEATQQNARQCLEETDARWSAQQGDLLAQRETLQNDLAGIEQARSEVIPNIEAGDLATYQALRRTKGGIAVVEMVNGACGGCGVGVSPRLEWHLRQDTFCTCSNCGRIIVRL